MSKNSRSLLSIVLTLIMVTAKSEDLPGSTNAAIQYETSIFAQGPTALDDFYKVAGGQERAAPGTLLKVEADANASLYNLPPATAVSRIQYQTESLQGHPVPASAYVLWPYQPRIHGDGKYPVVAWAHGTTGFHPDAAPSHMKTFSQHWQAPFPLVLQGYVVVAPDYAGLGVAKTADGKDIKHKFLANPAAANDVIYAVQAAQAAFPKLSSNFVVIGHSQGGGTSWAVAQRQAVTPIKGYLGAISISPVTNILELPITDNPLIPLLGAYAVPAMQSLYPDFDPLKFFTEKGWERYQLDQKVGGSTIVGVNIMTGFQVLRDDWRANSFLKDYIKLTANGGKKIGGPLLVIQGDQDPNMDVKTTSIAVKRTIQAFPKSQLQYIALPGISHVPAMYASQRLWLDWIDDRFKGVQVKAGYQDLSLKVDAVSRPLESFQSDPNWIIKTADAPYELM